MTNFFQINRNHTTQGNKVKQTKKKNTHVSPQRLIVVCDRHFAREHERERMHLISLLNVLRICVEGTDERQPSQVAEVEARDADAVEEILWKRGMGMGKERGKGRAGE